MHHTTTSLVPTPETYTYMLVSTLFLNKLQLKPIHTLIEIFSSLGEFLIELTLGPKVSPTRGHKKVEKSRSCIHS